MDDIRKIGVWQTAFLGDTVLTLPLLLSLRARWPEAELHYFVRQGYVDLFSGQSEITRVHTFDKRGRQNRLTDAVKLGRDLSRRGFDLWLSPHKSFRSALVARAAAAPVRVGYDKPWYNRFAWTHTIDRAFGKMDEVERILRLLDPIGVPVATNWPTINPPSQARAKAAAFWAERIHGPTLGMHPGSVWPTKRWPPAHFSRLMDWAVEHGLTVLLLAGPAEAELAGEIMAGAKHAGSDKVIDLSSQISLAELAAFLERLTIYVAGDSGHMHLAWALNTPVVALFGPTARELGFTPRSAYSTIAEIDLDCRPCGLHGHVQCPEGHHRCMTDLTPDIVAGVVGRQLREMGVHAG